MHTPRRAGYRQDHHTRTPVYRLLFLLLVIAGLVSQASAQTLSPGGPVDFGGINVGATSSPPTPLSFSVPANTVVTVGSVYAETLGSTGKDFVVSSTTCVGTHRGSDDLHHLRHLLARRAWAAHR